MSSKCKLLGKYKRDHQLLTHSLGFRGGQQMALGNMKDFEKYIAAKGIESTENIIL